MARSRQKKSAPAKPSAPSEAAAAFALIEPELDRVEKVAPINVDIPRAVAVAVGAVPHLKALRPRFVDDLPRFPIEALDKLMSYALAAWYAHLLALPAGPGQDVYARTSENLRRLVAALEARGRMAEGLRSHRRAGAPAGG